MEKITFLKKINLQRFAIFFSCISIVVVLFVFACNAYPVPGGDSTFFVVPALQFANKHVLTTPLFPDEQELRLVDPSGAKRFLIYPPLFPLVLARGMNTALPQDVFLTIAFINSIVVCVFGFVLYQILKAKNKLTWPSVFLVCLGLLSLASGLNGDSGRPEILGGLWVVLGMVVWLFAPKKYDWAWYGVLSGLMMATHLIGGVISFLILGVLFSIKLPFRSVFSRLCLVVCIAFFVFILVIAIGPFGVKETIIGTITNALAVSRGYAGQFASVFTLQNFIQYYFLSVGTPFYGLVLVLMVVSGWFFYRRQKERIISPVMFYISVAGLSLMLISMIYSVGHIFYLIPFTPIIFLGFIYYFLEKGFLPKMCVFLVMAFVATGVLRTIALYPFFLAQKPGFEAARNAFEKFTRVYPGDNASVGVSGSLWALSEDYDKMYVYNNWPEKPKENTSLIFFQQRYSGMLVPPEIKMCKLLEDKFSRETPKIFGIKFANTMPGYGYAVYNCL